MQEELLRGALAVPSLEKAKQPGRFAYLIDMTQQDHGVSGTCLGLSATGKGPTVSPRASPLPPP